MSDLRRILLNQDYLQRINAKPLSELTAGSKIESIFYPFVNNTNEENGGVTIYLMDSCSNTSGGWSIVGYPDGPIYSGYRDSSYESYHVSYAVTAYGIGTTFSSFESIGIIWANYQHNTKKAYIGLVGYYYEYPLSKIYKPYRSTGGIDEYFRFRYSIGSGRFYGSSIPNIFVTTID